MQIYIWRWAEISFVFYIVFCINLCIITSDVARDLIFYVLLSEVLFQRFNYILPLENVSLVWNFLLNI